MFIFEYDFSKPGICMCTQANPSVKDPRYRAKAQRAQLMWESHYLAVMGSTKEQDQNEIEKHLVYLALKETPFADKEEFIEKGSDNVVENPLYKFLMEIKNSTLNVASKS